MFFETLTMTAVFDVKNGVCYYDPEDRSWHSRVNENGVLIHKVNYIRDCTERVLNGVCATMLGVPTLYLCLFCEGAKRNKNLTEIVWGLQDGIHKMKEGRVDSFRDTTESYLVNWDKGCDIWGAPIPKPAKKT